MAHRDLVCGMEVDDDTPYQATHENNRFYFCSADCQETFEKTPQKYAAGGGSSEVH